MNGCLIMDPGGDPRRPSVIGFKPIRTLDQASSYEYPLPQPCCSQAKSRCTLDLAPGASCHIMSLAASQTVDQPIQRTRPPGLPTVRVHNPPVRPFRARDTMYQPAASDAIGTRHPHAQALAGAPSGPERASLRVSRPLQGAPRRPLASCLAPAVAAVAAR